VLPSLEFTLNSANPHSSEPLSLIANGVLKQTSFVGSPPVVKVSQILFAYLSFYSVV